jgi:hypothetical protein
MRRLWRRPHCPIWGVALVTAPLATGVWAGGSPAVLTLQPAGHTAGFYAVFTEAAVDSPSSGGLATATLAWSDPGGAQAIDSGQIFPASTGIVRIPDLPEAIYSNGVSALTLTFTETGDLSAASIRLYGAAMLAAS